MDLLPPDTKPSVADLDAMLQHAKLLRPPPSPPSSRTLSDADSHTHDATSTNALACVVDAAVAAALNHSSPSPSITTTTSLREPTMTVLDMDLHTSPRSLTEMNSGSIQVAHTARRSTLETRRKIPDCSCVAIELKFSPMVLSQLISHDTSVDLGSMVLAQQTMLDRFCTWCQQVDVAYILNVPINPDFHDHMAVASSPCLDLLSQYKAISLGALLNYQAFVNN